MRHSTVPRFKDHSGKTFGDWTVIKKADYKLHNAAVWTCRCSCGVERDVIAGALTSGKSRSCGCLQLQSATKHGYRNKPEYYVWKGIKARCNNPSTPNYHRYGGRGIRLYESWNSFESFLKDVGPRPSPDYSLDRIDNNGDYEPGNVRWTTRSIQANNTSTNTFVEFDGKRKTVAQWAKETGIGRTTIHYRLKAGWPIEKVLREVAPITMNAFFPEEA